MIFFEIYDLRHFTFCTADTSTLALYTTSALVVFIGRPQSSRPKPLTTYLLIRPLVMHPSTVGVIKVSPSVVLLDNHTTAKIGKVNCYGWKWETPPIEGNWWQGYHAKYIKLNNYDIRMRPLYYLYGGYVYPGSLVTVGAEGDYWSSTAYDNDRAYYLGFSSTNFYPSNNGWRFHGFSIRCLAR